MRLYYARTLSFSDPVNTSSVRLDTILQQVKPGNSVKVSWFHQTVHFIDVTPWREVRRSFGHSVVTAPANLKGELSDAVSKIRSLQACQFTVRIVRTADLFETEWKNILRNPYQWYKNSALESLSSLLRLYAV